MGKQLGGVNAPTVFNAVYNFVQFWDGRAADLAEQAGGPPLNPVEMASASWDEIIGKLKADKIFTNAFTAVYPGRLLGRNHHGRHRRIRKNAAHARFAVRPLPERRFDGVERGGASRIRTFQREPLRDLSRRPDARRTVLRTDGDSTGDYFADRGTEMTEEDNGRHKQTKTDYDLHRFKSSRTAERSVDGPYYHDGTRQTLDEAVSDMAKYQVGKTLPESDVNDLTAFLENP